MPARYNLELALQLCRLQLCTHGIHYLSVFSQDYLSTTRPNTHKRRSTGRIVPLSATITGSHCSNHGDESQEENIHHILNIFYFLVSGPFIYLIWQATGIQLTLV